MSVALEEFNRRWQEIPASVRLAAERDPHLRAVLRAHAGAPAWDLVAALTDAVTSLAHARQHDLSSWAQHLRTR